MNRLRSIAILAILLGLVVCIAIPSYLASTVSLELDSFMGPNAPFKEFYLEAHVVVPWPKTALKLYAPFFKLRGFSWQDQSGEFTYDDQAYVVIQEATASTALLGEDELRPPHRVTTIINSTPFVQGLVQLSSVDDFHQLRTIRIYYKVKRVGAPASSYSGPYRAELHYSYLGFPLTARAVWRAW